MYKILMLTLQNTHVKTELTALTEENRKTLLSELKEIAPSLLR